MAATKNLIRYLVSRNTHHSFIYELCFEGRTIPCGVWSRTTPQSVYAKTKCALEEAIKFNFSDQCAVVRITKIVPTTGICTKFGKLNICKMALSSLMEIKLCTP